MHISGRLALIALTLLFLAAALAGCSATVKETSRPEQPLKPKILIGTSTKADVEGLLGPPTETLNREGEVWVYRDLKVEDMAGLMPFYCGDKPLVFSFSLDGTVSRISRRVPVL